MKKLISTLVLGILLGLLVLCAWPVQAGTNGTSPPACPPGENGHADRMDKILDTLEEKGYDVSAIRAAAESGDIGTARSLLQQFMQENRDALPAPPGKKNGGGCLSDGTGTTNPSGTQPSPGERNHGNRPQRGFMKQSITPAS